MEVKGISKAIIARLPRYYRYLGDLITEGVERISSNELSQRMGVTASQIRQDLNHFGGFGQQGYGYNVPYLHDEIGKIIGLDKEYHMIIIGAGNLGRAIANYDNFERRGFIVDAIFDINPELRGATRRGIPIYEMNETEMENFLAEHHVDIAVLTIPRQRANEVAQFLVAKGIRAIWNFAHVDLDLPADVVVENVHLSESLMKLSYTLANPKE